ncbi:MAG: sensor histidine kinase N-terminal domain-containing protein [Phycisphaerae bacterium]|nr:sensor histidine kinase N-terminal domain-containing protein [Phycisphaerae bacterium]
MTRSLRRTLILGTMGGITVVLLAAGTLIYVLVRSNLVEQFDRSLADKARMLASTVEQESKKIELEFEEYDLGEFQRPDGPGYLQLWLSDGAVLHRSASLGSRDMERKSNSRTGSPMFRWVVLPNGRTGRAVELTFHSRVDEDDWRRADQKRTGPMITLVLARDARPLEATLNSLRWVLVGVGLVALILSTGVLWLVIRRGLAPLNQVAEQISRLGDRDLAERIHAGDAPVELQPVVNRLNDLLGRLEAAFGRERSFSADVAHELRTPLAGLRSTMEVALSKARQPAEYAEAIDDCLQMALRMQAMAESLLALARLEAGQVNIELESVVPDDLVRTTWGGLEAEATRRNLQVRWTLGATQAIRTDPTLMRLVVGNIMDNAVIYTDEGGTVEIETTGDNDKACVRVANSGSTISRDQTEIVFERFFRGDSARSATGVNCGLGLALVRRAVSVLGGSVEVKSSAGGQFEITASIPSLNSPADTLN